MKNLLFPCVFIILAAAVTGCGRHEENTATEIDRLRMKISEIQTQVDRLRQKVEILEKLVVLTPEVVPQGIIRNENIPPGGRAFTFNGMRYFVMPLSSGASNGGATSEPPARYPSRPLADR